MTITPRMIRPIPIKAAVLTGKDSYLFCGSNLGIDTITHPEILLEPKWAALSAGWFWNKKDLNTLADAGDIKEI